MNEIRVRESFDLTVDNFYEVLSKAYELEDKGILEVIESEEHWSDAWIIVEATPEAINEIYSFIDSL